MKKILTIYITILFMFLITGCSYVNPPKDPYTLYIHLPSEPGTLNPITATDAYSTILLKHVTESLFDLHWDDLTYVPQLAERWNVSADKLRIRFFLKKGVLWSDGKEFTADDVVYSYRRIMDPKVPCAQLRVYYKNIINVIKLNKYAVEFRCDIPSYNHLSACGFIPIVPKHIFNDGTDFHTHKNSRHPIGTGPYKFVRWDTGKQVVLERNELYRGKKPDIKQLVYKLIPEIAVAFQMFQKGDIDVMKVRAIQWSRQTVSEKFNERFYKLKYFLSVYYFIGWNSRKEIFKDRRVRQAMTHMVNRKALIEKLNFGLGKAITGPFYIKSESYDKSLKLYEYNVEKAKKLLKEAGWSDTDNDGILDKNGKKFEFTFTISSGSKFSQRLVSILKEDLAKVGIEMNINKYEWAVYINKIQNHDFDANTMGWSDPSFDDDIYQIFHSSMAPKGSNYVNFVNRKADILLSASKLEFDKKKRAAINRKIHKIIHYEQPYTFLFTSPELAVVNKRFSNVIIHTRGLNLTEWKVRNAK